ncbi:MAG: SRPBCC domain-containing protein [Pseudomonadota bacterium]|nr:SRPBCC domain-containing protein [Pseudomonadota bacterium]
MFTAVHQEIDFAAPPERVYAALTNADQFKAMTNAPAELDAKAGGAISLFGGMITGFNLEVVPNQRLVQAWRAGNWAPGMFSIARFELTPSGAGTRLVFDHSGITEDMREHLEAGWHKMYWEPLAKMLAQ